MICLHDAKTRRDDVISTNGDYILDNICTKMIIKEDLNVLVLIMEELLNFLKFI